MLARSDSGVLPLRRAPVDVRELVERVAAEVRPRAAEKGIALDVAGVGEPMLDADEDLLMQLMLNLSDNAVTYTATGNVMLGWRPTAGAVELYVRDTGRGIPKEHRARVFERFYRADSSRASNGGGAGLGLAICKSIVDAHGGTITVDETDGGGATFVVRLPSAQS
jgi:two-component system OmpR family sensor kinase